jgi:hypothetical protein
MAEIREKARRAAERLKDALEDLAEELAARLGHEAPPVLVPVPVRGRGNVYAGALVRRSRPRR